MTVHNSTDALSATSGVSKNSYRKVRDYQEAVEIFRKAQAEGLVRKR